MTDASSKTGGKANGAEPLATTVSTRSTVSRGAITPALALARHVEWLDFALAAARSEETWRAARLKKATKKTLDKRTSRLAEVRDEIAELAALIQAIRGLKPSAASRSTAGAAKPRAAGAAKPRATGARKRTAAAPKPSASASAAAASTTATRAATARKRSTTAKPAASKPAATKKPAATAKKPSASTTTRRARRPAGPPADGPA
jgi:hypothetical protein